MKILYLSTPSFADCDFPLIKEFIRQGHDITYLITLTPYSLKSTLFNIEKQLPCNDIIPASKYKELYIYSEYMNLDKKIQKHLRFGKTFICKDHHTCCIHNEEQNDRDQQ